MPLPPAQPFRPPLPWVARDRSDHGTRPGALRGFVPRVPVYPAGGGVPGLLHGGAGHPHRRGASPRVPVWVAGAECPGRLAATWAHRAASSTSVSPCPPAPCSLHPCPQASPPACTDGGLRLPALRPDASHSQVALPGHPRAAHCAHGAPLRTSLHSLSGLLPAAHSLLSGGR